MFYQLISLCLFLGVVECISRCQKMDLPVEVWKNEGVAVIYVMKNSLQNWQTHVTALTHLLKSLKNIDVNANLIIATDTDCLAFRNIREFKIDSGNIWKKLEHNDDYPEAYVIDRCGKMTYHIISPWSLVKSFSFVKGAILSTFFDKPCGPCDVFHSYQVSGPSNKPKEEAIKVYPRISPKFEKVTNEGTLPIEIIMKDTHKHEGTDEVFEYTEMELGNVKHHRHFHNIDDIDFFPESKYKELPKNGNLLILDGDDQMINIADEPKQDHFKHTTYKTKKKRVISRSDEQSTISSSIPTISDIDKKISEITLMCTDIKDPEQAASKYLEKLDQTIYKALYSSEEQLTSEAQEEKDQMFHHYQKLKNWIYYII